jgi:cold shock CspA family protein
MESKETGIVKTFVRERGFGFLGRKGQKDLFFHVSAVDSDDREKVHQGARVGFVVGSDRSGRPVAVNVTLQGGNQ